MTPQEAQIIEEVFAKLREMPQTGADAEAAGLVEAKLKGDRNAGLALVRAVVMLEHDRNALAEQARDLTARLEAAQAGQAARPAAPTGGLFGPAPTAPGPWGPAPRAPQPPAGPWGQTQQASGPWDQPPAQPQGGGFWSSALRTGAGVAGGLFAFEAVRGLFGGGHGGSAGLFGGGAMGAGGLFDQPTTIVNETVNVFQSDTAREPTTGGFFGGDVPSDPQDTAAQDVAFDDDAGDFGGSDDSWA